MTKKANKNTQAQAVETKAVETKAVETKAVENKENVVKELNALKESLAILQQKKAEKIARLKANTIANKYYSIIAEFAEKNGLTLKAVKDEDNKVFVQKNGKNIMFVLFKSNNIVSIYTAFTVNETSQYSTYNKRLCYRTNFTSSPENEKTVLDLINVSNSTVVTARTTNVNELLNKIDSIEKAIK